MKMLLVFLMLFFLPFSLAQNMSSASFELSMEQSNIVGTSSSASFVLDSESGITSTNSTSASFQSNDIFTPFELVSPVIVLVPIQGGGGGSIGGGAGTHPMPNVTINYIEAIGNDVYANVSIRNTEPFLNQFYIRYCLVSDDIQTCNSTYVSNQASYLFLPNETRSFLFFLDRSEDYSSLIFRMEIFNNFVYLDEQRDLVIVSAEQNEAIVNIVVGITMVGFLALAISRI